MLHVAVAALLLFQGVEARTLTVRLGPSSVEEPGGR